MAKKIHNGSDNGNGVRKQQLLTGTAKRQRKNGNATEWWKPGINRGSEDNALYYYYYYTT